MHIFENPKYRKNILPDSKTDRPLVENVNLLFSSTLRRSICTITLMQRALEVSNRDQKCYSAKFTMTNATNGLSFRAYELKIFFY